MIRLVLVLLLATTACIPCRAQNLRGGIQVNGGRAMHEGSFSGLPDAPTCCADLGNGSGVLFGVGGVVDYLVLPGLRLSGMVSGNYSTAMLSSSQNIPVHVGGGTEQGEISYLFEASSFDIAIEPMLFWYPVRSFRIGGGMALRFPAVHGARQWEAITRPTDAGTFLDEQGRDTHSRTRNEVDEDVPGVQSTMSLVLRIGAEIPLQTDSSFMLVPEFFFRSALTDNVDWAPWKTHHVGLSFSLLWSRKNPLPVPAVQPVPAQAPAPPAEEQEREEGGVIHRE